MTLFTLLALSLPISAFPCLALEGKIVLEDGTPVVDATVSILGRPGSTRTDPQGRFTWKPDPVVPFDLLVVLAGEKYTMPVRVLRVPEGAPAIITVIPLASEAVTVTAEAAPNTQAPPAAGADLLRQEDLEQRHPARLVDAIENIPGAGRLESGHEGVPSLRGLARGRTLILIDGHRVTSERRAGPSAGFLDPFFLDAVEITRGPGFVAYGSDSLGGVIHARTRQAAPGSPWALRGYGSAGTGVPQWSVGAEVSRGLAQGGFVLQARARGFDDYRSPAGEIPNSSGTERGFLGRLDREIGPGKFSAALEADAARDLERAQSTSNVTRVTEPLEDSYRLTFGYQMDPLADATLLSFSGFLGSNRRVSQQERLPTAAAPGLVSLSDVRARDFGVRTFAVHPFGRARIEGGLDVNGRTGLKAFGSTGKIDEMPIEDASRIDSGLYVSGEMALRRSLNATAGLRGDLVTTRSSGGYFGRRRTGKGTLSGLVALSGGPYRGFTLTGQMARGFRDPSLSDRYYRGISGRGFVTGSPDLEPETSLQWDVAVRYATRRFRAAVYGYRYRIEDLVERYEDPNRPSPIDPNGAGYFFRNRGEAVLRGIEMQISAQIGREWTFEIAAQTARGEAEDGSALADVPVESFILQVRRSLYDRAYVYGRAALFGRDERPGPTERLTPGYAALDLGGGWRAGGGFEVRALVRNVLDKECFDSSDEKAVPAPGIAAILTLAVSLGG